MAVAPVDGRLRRTEIDGIPVWSADAPEPTRASLTFRVGRADETLASSGLTHLVEHLVMFDLGDTGRSGAFVDPVKTVFYTAGTPEEVADFLARVCSSLDALPLHRIALEKQVLTTEAASHGGSPHDAYGAGLVPFLYGMQVFAHRSYAVFPLLLGFYVLVRTHLRRRRRASLAQARA